MGFELLVCLRFSELKPEAFSSDPLSGASRPTSPATFTRSKFVEDGTVGVAPVAPSRRVREAWSCPFPKAPWTVAWSGKSGASRRRI